MHRIESCEFQRSEGGQWEPGLLIDDGKRIIAADGTSLRLTWNWRRTPALAVDFSELETYMPILTALLARVGKVVQGKE